MPISPNERNRSDSIIEIHPIDFHEPHNRTRMDTRKRSIDSDATAQPDRPPSLTSVFHFTRQSIEKQEAKPSFSGGSTNIYKAMDVLDHLSQAKNEESWTVHQEEILNLWAEKALLYRWLHLKTAEYYSFINNLLTYPTILLSSVLGMSGFAMITREKPTMFEIIIAYIMAGCNFLVAVLSSIQKVKQYSEKSEQHTTASVAYIKFYREIKLELAIDRGSRAYSIDFCKTMKTKFNKLTKASPMIPANIQRRHGEYKPPAITDTYHTCDFM